MSTDTGFAWPGGGICRGLWLFRRCRWATIRTSYVAAKSISDGARTARQQRACRVGRFCAARMRIAGSDVTCRAKFSVFAKSLPIYL